MSLYWKNKKKDSLRGVWGTGSKSTEKRARRNQRELQREASQSLSLIAMFQRQKDLQLSVQVTTSSNTVSTSNVAIPRACSPPQVPNALFNKEEVWKTASARLDRLLKLPTEQKNVYGAVIDPRSSFHLRHRMVQSFLWLQERRDQFPVKTQIHLARLTANSFNRGGHTSRMIIQ